MRSFQFFIVGLLTLTLFGCSGEIQHFYGKSLPDAPFQKEQSMTLRNSVKLSLAKESPSNTYYLIIENTNNQFGLTPMLQKNGDIARYQNTSKEERMLTEDRFALSEAEYALFDEAFTYTLTDTLTKRKYIVIMNFDGDGISILEKQEQ